MNPKSNNREKQSSQRKLIIQPIKLKSIHEERALNRCIKFNKSSSQVLTDFTFEHKSSAQASTNSKNFSPIQSNNIKQKLSSELKFDLASLQLEIANATSKALSSIQSYETTKESFSSSQRFKHFNMTKTSASNESSPLIRDQVLIKRPSDKKLNCFRIKTPQSNLKLENMLKYSNWVIRESNCESEGQIEIKKKIEKIENGRSGKEEKPIKKSKENIFIDKIREATLKLRRLRECVK